MIPSHPFIYSTNRAHPFCLDAFDGEKHTHKTTTTTTYTETVHASKELMQNEKFLSQTHELLC